MPIAEPIAATSNASAMMHDCGFLRVGEQLGEPAPQAQRGDLRGEFDDQHRIGEAAERGRPINSPADEQERHHSREPQHEAEDVEPAASRKRRHVGVGRRSLPGRREPCRSMRLAPMLAPADLDVERHVELDRRLGGVGHHLA